MTDIAIRTDPEPEIDGELLAEAQRQLGDPWPNQAINVALRELVEDRRARRGRAYDNLQRMAEEGGFDFDAVEDADFETVARFVPELQQQRVSNAAP